MTMSIENKKTEKVFYGNLDRKKEYPLSERTLKGVVIRQWKEAWQAGGKTVIRFNNPVQVFSVKRFEKLFEEEGGVRYEKLGIKYEIIHDPRIKPSKQAPVIEEEVNPTEDANNEVAVDVEVDADAEEEGGDVPIGGRRRRRKFDK